MGDIKDNLIFGSIENIMKSDRGLYDAEVRADMATVGRKFINKCTSEFFAEEFKLSDIHTFNIRRRFNCRQINFIFHD